mmetsp:Transcript_1460/g.4142  ORF Transcript_1460/g.4142 Transcript_1460/m.4142 type:complete len:256 (-) Transcript_1460:480-1247(-)
MLGISVVAALAVAVHPGLADIGIPLGVRGYRVGQVGERHVHDAAGVINRCFFSGSREGQHNVDLVRGALCARMGPRLRTGGIQHDERGALVIGVQRRMCSDIVALAELSVQPRNGRVPGNFRPKVFPGDPEMVPYICNLAVDEAHRQRGIARALMNVCESVARDVWGFPELYLHVDGRNDAALHLYQSLGYDPLPRWDVPEWKEQALGLVPNRYHRKVITLDPDYVPYQDPVEQEMEEEAAVAGRRQLGFAVPSP